MKKRILSTLLSLTMVLSFFQILNISSSAYLVGTEQNPILLKSYADLSDLSEKTSNGQSFDGKYFKLDDSFPTDEGAVTKPIGNVTYPFKGNFDGNNKRVKVLINITATSDVYGGLFGYIDTSKSTSRATIKNVNMYGCICISSTSKIWVGGVAGYVLGANFENCSSTVFITAKTSGKTAAVYTGGLIGGLNPTVTTPFEDTTEKSTVNNCHTEATVRSYSVNNSSFGYTGNLCGTSSHVVINNCYSRGVSCSSGYKLTTTGGLCGSTYSAKINNCFSAGQAYAEKVSNYTYVAGIAGYLQGKSPSIDNCYSTTELNAFDSTSISKGGIVAYNMNSNADIAATITHSYCTYSTPVGTTDALLKKDNVYVIDSDMKVNGVDLTKALCDRADDIKATTWGIVKGFNNEYPINKQVFNITDATTDNNVTVNVRPNASVGSCVEIEANVKNGYAIDKIKVYKTGDESASVTVFGQNFIMPKYNVSIKITLKQVIPITEKTVYEYGTDGKYISKTVYNLNENNQEDSIYIYKYENSTWSLTTKKEYTYDADGNKTEEKTYVMNVATPYMKSKATVKYVKGNVSEQETIMYNTNGTVASCNKNVFTYDSGSLVRVDCYSDSTLKSYDLYTNTANTSSVTSYNNSDTPISGRTYSVYDSSKRLLFMATQDGTGSKLDNIETTIYDESGEIIAEEFYTSSLDGTYPIYDNGYLHCANSFTFNNSGHKLAYNKFKFDTAFSDYSISLFKYDKNYRFVGYSEYDYDGQKLCLNNKSVNDYFEDGLRKSITKRNSKDIITTIETYNRYPEISDVTSDDNGTITVASSACNDTEVTITPNPNSGCYLNSLEAYKTGDKNTIVPINNNKFVMPEYNVTVKATFVRDLENVTIASIANKTYTGNAITPALTVTDGKKTLVKDVDYTVDYSDNIDAGTASVAIYGIGAYCGSNITTFEIEQASGLEITAESYLGMYDGEAHGLNASVNIIDGTTVMYSYDNGDSWTEEEPSYTDACDYDIIVCATNPNYITDEENYSIQINKRNVTLTSGSASRIADGTPLTNNNVTVSGDKFVIGEGATYDVTGSQTDIGSSENTFTVDFNINTKAENYNVTRIYGTLTVTEPYKVLFEQKKQNTITELEEFGNTHGNPVSKHIVEKGVKLISELTYDESKSYEENCSNIEKYQKNAIDNVTLFHNIVYKCPFLGFFARLLQPLFSVLEKVY